MLSFTNITTPEAAEHKFPELPPLCNCPYSFSVVSTFLSSDKFWSLTEAGQGNWWISGMIQYQQIHRYKNRQLFLSFPCSDTISCPPLRLFWRLPGWQTCFEACQPLCRAPLPLGIAVLKNNGWEQGEGQPLITPGTSPNRACSWALLGFSISDHITLKHRSCALLGEFY